jgi:hypothetical protein
MKRFGDWLSSMTMPPTLFASLSTFSGKMFLIYEERYSIL